jgi:cystathionine gamma-synthase
VTQSPADAGPDGLHQDTRLVVGGRPAHVPGAPLSEPITLASTYVADGQMEYGRWGNPTWTAFEDVVGALEHGRALAFASGMAAISAAFDVATARSRVGDRGIVVVPDQAYSGTLTLIGDRGHPVDIADTDAVLAAIAGRRDEITALWIESPTNPGLQIADIPALCAGARELGAMTVVDNTFATPLGQQPLDHGADVVVHSATKLLSGHSDLLLGVAVTSDEEIFASLEHHRRMRGATPSAFDVFLATRGLRTLAVRRDRASENARVLAQRLAGHPSVARVRYPGLPSDPGHQRAARLLNGFGTIVCVEFTGGPVVADAVCRAVRLWVPATSLGGVESTLERRRRWPAESSAVDESLVRLSVGIENVEDLWADLDQALGVAT